ncbi:MAG: WecB/TagA/CpsF family glycosyltransferase, partial [Ghiorsea sp.]
MKLDIKQKIFGIPFHAWTMTETVQCIVKRIHAGCFTQHVVINVAKVVHAQKDIELRESIEACDIINVDGMGVVWGARFLGVNVPERVSGVDLFLELVQESESEGFPVFLLGATEDVVRKTSEVLRDKHPQLQLAGYHHGYFWDNEKEVVDKIRSSGAKLLFVAI